MEGICIAGDNCVDIYSGLRESCFLGGNGVNTALAVLKQGVKSAYVGVVGNDPAGNSILRTLSHMGMGTGRVRQLEGATGWTRIALIDGDRKFIDENIGVQRFFALSPEDYAYMSGFSWVHHTAFSNWPTAVAAGIPSYFESMAAQFERIGALSGGFSVDFSDRQDVSLLESAGRNRGIGFFSRLPMVSRDLENTCRELHDHGFSVVVVTMGEGGSAAWDGHAMHRQEALPTKVVDTLGAGDAFIGAFLARWVGGEDVESSLHAGAWLAARVCEKAAGYKPLELELEAKP
ncbi:MAG: PfkB family carbohydrate kinase [Spirochaetes bacterium]|nr:PfkB family carbohydrate kinase [Spirochaetota bacterium]